MSYGYPDPPAQRLLYADSQGNLSPTPPADSNAALATQLRGNLSGALAGQLPPDVVQQIQQNAAEFGVSSGLSGSQFAGYQGLKNLGLTSLNRAQQAEQELVNPLLGYHPLQILPNTALPPTSPQSNIDWRASTSPVGTTGITGGGGNRTMPAPLQDPRAAWAQQSGQDSFGSFLDQLAAKYGGKLTGAGGVGFASPMGGGGTLPNYGGVAPGPAQGYGSTSGTGSSSDVPYDPRWNQAQTDAWLSGEVQPTSSGFMSMGQNPDAPQVQGYASVAPPLNYGDTNEDSFWG